MFGDPIDLKLNICPKPMLTDWSRQMLRFYRHYKNNILPYGGALLDQPDIYLQAMEIIDSAVDRLKEEAAIKARRP